MGTKYDPNIHHRRSIRLPGYDYSQAGAYFLTTCAQHRECLFGAIYQSQVNLNDYGQIVDRWWHHLPTRFNDVEIDEAIIMPNHFHGIIVIHPPSPQPPTGAVTAPLHNPLIWGGDIPNMALGGETPPLRERATLGKIVAYFKYQTTKLINQLRGTPGQKVWQRNYYEHIIRSETSLDRLRHYIRNNPQQWVGDQLHPQVASKW